MNSGLVPKIGNLSVWVFNFQNVEPTEMVVVEDTEFGYTIAKYFSFDSRNKNWKYIADPVRAFK